MLGFQGIAGVHHRRHGKVETERLSRCMEVTKTRFHTSPLRSVDMHADKDVNLAERQIPKPLSDFLGADSGNGNHLQFTCFCRPYE